MKARRARMKPHWNDWTPAEDDLLRTHIGTMPTPQLSQRWPSLGGQERSARALELRCVRLGISSAVQGYSHRELQRIFGCGRPTIKVWIDEGHLIGQRFRGHRATGEAPAVWWFSHETVAAFLRAHHWLVDVRRMLPRHPVTRLAQVAHQADPWLTLQELAPHLGLSRCNRYFALGVIPHRVRPCAKPQAKKRGMVVVRARDIPAIRESVRRIQEDARRRRDQHAPTVIQGLQRDARGRLKRREVAA